MRMSKRKFRNYILCGGVAFVLNIGMFQFFCFGGMDYKLANIISLLFNRFFTYATNKVFVFRTKCDSFNAMLREFISFFLARMLTLLMDYFGVCILVEVLHCDALISKMIITLLVVIINYLLSEYVVFKNRNESRETN